MNDTALAPRPLAREATRHPITMDEALALQAMGAFKGKRTQLLDGEIHEMPSDGPRHIVYAMEIGAKIIRALDPSAYFVGVQTTLHLTPYNGPSPDVYVLSAGPILKRTQPERILLVVEVADTSLRDDLNDSASRYARHNVRDFWVVDVRNRVTHVHRNPEAGVYPPPLRAPFEEPIAPALIPGFALRLADFDAAAIFEDDD